MCNVFIVCVTLSCVKRFPSSRPNFYCVENLKSFVQKGHMLPLWPKMLRTWRGLTCNADFVC